MDHQITDIAFRPYQSRSQTTPRTDIVGWVSCVFNGLFLNNIMVKTLPSGKMILAYPRYARGTNERTHFYFNPTDHATRDVLDAAILEHVRRTIRHEST
ncbi:hypothetical protein LCGC14_2439540 [marine sediment metagenome]|uniref:SpoVG family protein n=1 Tax=marine sediment metagenome TaxID=412755 RepID=A0A0F9BJF8_9ZZZZ